MRLQQGFTTGGMGSDRHFAWQQSLGPNVRFGSEGDIQAVRPMSALPPKADISSVLSDASVVPFDHLVGERDCRTA